MVAPVRRPETMALILAAVSGYVDAFIYLRVYPVFTANQSGNLIFAGVGLGEGHWAVASASLVAIAAYVAGAAIGSAAFDRERLGGRQRFRGALGAEVVVLGALMVTSIALGRGHEASRHVDLPVLAIVACTSVAMGLQGIALRKVHGVGVLTTGGTGNVTTIGERIGRVGVDSAKGDDELALGVIGGVVVVYVVGAVVGAVTAGISSVGPILIVIPIAGVATALLIQHAAAPAET